MKYLLAGSIVLFGLASVNVADAKSLPPLPPPVYSWTGCYVGANGGYGWNTGGLSHFDPNTDADPINGRPDLNPGVTDAYIPTPTSTNGSGGLVGGTGGCNQQIQQWVIGFEADIDWANISGSRTTSINSGPLEEFKSGPAGYTTSNNTGTVNEQAAVRWLSTVRLRGGFAVGQNLLLYGTGGLAVGGLSSHGSVTTFSPFPGFVNPTWGGSTSTTKAGGVIGAGLEWAFDDRWTVKMEYLWYDLGNITHPLNCTNACTFAYPTLGTVSASASGSIVRVGINYRLW